MPKQLKIKNVNSSFCLTVRELKAFLNTATPLTANGIDENIPVLLKCGGRNYRLLSFKLVSGKPVLIGKRSARD
jgi:hypothetical protein